MESVRVAFDMNSNMEGGYVLTNSKSQLIQDRFQGKSATVLMKVDAKLGPWAEWSSCSITCLEENHRYGNGVKNEHIDNI